MRSLFLLLSFATASLAGHLRPRRPQRGDWGAGQQEHGDSQKVLNLASALSASLTRVFGNQWQAQNQRPNEENSVSASVINPVTEGNEAPAAAASEDPTGLGVTTVSAATPTYSAAPPSTSGGNDGTSSTTGSLTIEVTNNCDGTVKISGGPFGSGQELTEGTSCEPDNCSAWRVWQDDGTCGDNGEGCILVEGTLTGKAENSIVDNSLVSPHAFNVPAAFQFIGTNVGRSCQTAECKCDYDAYCVWDDDLASIGPGTDNFSGVAITFC